MQDGKFKQPKVLKDMFLELARDKPALLHELSTTGFTIMGEKIVMVIMDIPAGHVCRVTRTKPLFFPVNAEQFITRLMPLIRVVWSGRQLMEKTLDLLLADQEEISVELDNGDEETVVFVPPSFHSARFSSSPSSSELSPRKKKARASLPIEVDD
ncbi:hypothetical protein EC973_004385 [Apophysomyces ossiformis]|uniref:Uncharacterized protein n=1 Tax=Apophysomyces ossiformis TaxID=679940 RepID=A0A8H7BWU0_9FUNG|nr:hypothetical protein EC973_004385 [Apophysomyces ossiformis]